MDPLMIAFEVAALLGVAAVLLSLVGFEIHDAWVDSRRAPAPGLRLRAAAAAVPADKTLKLVGGAKLTKPAEQFEPLRKAA